VRISTFFSFGGLVLPSNWRCGGNYHRQMAGDNIGIYLPLFASNAWPNLVTIVSVFLILVGVWCFTAHQLTQLPAIANLITSHGSHFVPCVLIGLGVLYNQGKSSLAFLPLSLSYGWTLFSPATQIYLIFDSIQIHLKEILDFFHTIYNSSAIQ
jgi:hypothetical protein